MSTDSNPGNERVVGRATTNETQSETGSVWWAELVLGGVLTLAAAVFVLVQTSIGPFATLGVTYGPLLTALLLLTMLSLAATFLSSGVRQSPYAAADSAATGVGDGDASQHGDD